MPFAAWAQIRLFHPHLPPWHPGGAGLHTGEGVDDPTFGYTSSPNLEMESMHKLPGALGWIPASEQELLGGTSWEVP